MMRIIEIKKLGKKVPNGVYIDKGDIFEKIEGTLVYTSELWRRLWLKALTLRYRYGSSFIYVISDPKKQEPELDSTIKKFFDKFTSELDYCVFEGK